jgi:hypothetical protein
MSETKKPHDGLSREIIRRYLGRISWRRRAQLQQRANFDEKYPEDPITAFLVSGNQFFDKKILITRKRELTTFAPWRQRPVGEDGFLRMFHPRTTNRRYVIGADVAMGIPIKLDDPDYQAAVVLDLETGEEMASYRAHVPAQDYAFDLAELGEYYNSAIIAVERSSEGGAVILTLAGDCGYNAIYKHRDWWKRQKKVLMDFEGFPMNLKTRPTALNMVNRFVLETPELVWCAHFVQEALTFVRNEKGIPAGMEGVHDDTVMCRAIAHMVRRIQLGWYVPWEARSEKYVSADRITLEEEPVEVAG